MEKEELIKSKQEFIDLLKSTAIEGIDDVIAELEDLGFFKAPASMKNHLCYEGGLMIHSLNVYYCARTLKESFMPMRPDVMEKISNESLIIASLLHDVCKSRIYFRKKGAQYEFGKAEYGSDYSDLPVGHGEKSVIMLLQMGLGLTDAEICAIRWHMGAWSVAGADGEMQSSFRLAQELYPLVSIIQTADTLAASILERKATTIN